MSFMLKPYDEPEHPYLLVFLYEGMLYVGHPSTVDEHVGHGVVLRRTQMFNPCWAAVGVNGAVRTTIDLFDVSDGRDRGLLTSVWRECSGLAITGDISASRPLMGLAVGYPPWHGWYGDEQKRLDEHHAKKAKEP